MKNKLFEIFKNFSYSLSSNFVSLIISTLVILVIPKIIGVKEYGLWQLYIFYSNYVGFLHFGWNDGIYLRYGGKKYNELDKNIFFSQFYSLLISQIIIGVAIISATYLFISDIDRQFIFSMIGLVVILVNANTFLLYVLQMTNRIKDYSIIAISDRIIYISIIGLMLFRGITDYKLLIFADIIAKSFALFLGVFLCKEIVINSFSKYSINFHETLLNIESGIKLMFANIANMLIIGIVRFGIERNWSVSVFGQISLTLSVSNMFMMFINALGIVIFPILRRINQTRLISIYKVMRDLLMLIVFGAMIFYTPVNKLLSSWLPEYAESLNYMGLLFPIVIYQSKMSLLINTYLKALRLEKVMLRVNLVTMIMSVLLTALSTVLLNDLDLAIFSIVFLMIFRGIISETLLSKKLKINVYKDIILELIMTSIFIYTSWFLNNDLTLIIYLLFYLIYILMKFKDFKYSLKYIVNLTN